MMKIHKDNILNFVNIPESAICIPTNGIVKSNNSAVMGGGLAKVIRDTYKYSDNVLGELIINNGNRVQQFYENPNFIAFPTKMDYKDKSRLSLIAKSCRQLVRLQDKKQFKKIFLPKVGTGLGQLSWESVFHILKLHLNEKIYEIVDIH